MEILNFESITVHHEKKGVSHQNHHFSLRQFWIVLIELIREHEIWVFRLPFTLNFRWNNPIILTQSVPQIEMVQIRFTLNIRWHLIDHLRYANRIRLPQLGLFLRNWYLSLEHFTQNYGLLPRKPLIFRSPEPRILPQFFIIGSWCLQLVNFIPIFLNIKFWRKPRLFLRQNWRFLLQIRLFPSVGVLRWIYRKLCVDIIEIVFNDLIKF